MQKESNNRKALLCTDLGQPCGVALLQLAFRCPRCGERQRFRSLSSLRPHLEYSHLYRTANNLSPVSRCDVGDVLLNHKKPSEAGCTKNCESSPAKKQGPVDSMGRNEGFKSEATASTGHPQGSTGKEVGPGVAIEKSDAIGAEDCRAGLLVPAKARAERQLVDTLRPADSPIEKRLWKVSTELLKKEAELLDVHTQSRHLALAKQEVLERERALCQQVDTAVMVISSLKEHLRQSEKELEKKEQ
ncbi:hypothetical protein JZ751_007837 [Albula glossodonta]|uniref:FBX41/ZN365 C2H2-type zinc finger domain-containing protein n=1 Tax=Albula glossodonta TaxID=121402 RepID=A0A8T2P8T4_9TELE|nr:hypothetical protein JZ751_007837 [Albula glossodonta]